MIFENIQYSVDFRQCSSYIFGDFPENEREKNVIGSIKVRPFPSLHYLTWKLGNQFTVKI